MPKIPQKGRVTGHLRVWGHKARLAYREICGVVWRALELHIEEAHKALHWAPVQYIHFHIFLHSNSHNSESIYAPEARPEGCQAAGEPLARAPRPPVPQSKGRKHSICCRKVENQQCLGALMCYRGHLFASKAFCHAKCQCQARRTCEYLGMTCVDHTCRGAASSSSVT